jgi:hypothetical protein
MDFGSDPEKILFHGLQKCLFQTEKKYSRPASANSAIVPANARGLSRNAMLSYKRATTASK